MLRTFRLSSGTTPVGVVVAHEGGFPISWFIIGDGPFKKPPIFRLAGLKESLPSKSVN